MMKSCLAGAAAMLVYGALAAILLLWPHPLDLRHAVIAGQITDTSVVLWSLAWWPWAIGHGVNPLITHALWAPVGQNLVWCTSLPTLALLFWPITVRWGPIVSYNVIALLAPVLAAWSAYLLGREITKKQFLPSLFGGGIFGFSSYTFGELIPGHLFLIFTAAIPLLVWVYLLRRRGKLSRWPYLILVCLLLVFQFGISTEIFATTTLFAFLAITFDIAVVSDSTLGLARFQPLVEAIVALAMTAVILSPLFYYIFFKGYIRGPLNPPELYYTDPLNYLIPTPLTALGSKFFLPISSAFSGNLSEQLAFLGAPLILIIVLFIREFSSRPSARMAILILATVVVASLGAQLGILGHTLPVILPWMLFVHLPLIDNALPSRFPLYATLVAAVISAWWLAESKVRRCTKIILAGLSILFLVPQVSAASWVFPAQVPPFCTSADCARYFRPGDNVIIFPYGYEGASMLWQAQANFRFSMVGGYINMPAANPPQFQHSQVVAILYNYGLYGAGIPADYPALLQKFIHKYNVAAFIIPDSVRQKFAALVAPLRIQPIETGSVQLYLLHQLPKPAAAARSSPPSGPVRN